MSAQHCVPCLTSSHEEMKRKERQRLSQKAIPLSLRYPGRTHRAAPTSQHVVGDHGADVVAISTFSHGLMIGARMNG